MPSNLQRQVTYYLCSEDSPIGYSFAPVDIRSWGGTVVLFAHDEARSITGQQAAARLNLSLAVNKSHRTYGADGAHPRFSCPSLLYHGFPANPQIHYVTVIRQGYKGANGNHLPCLLTGRVNTR